MDDFFEITKFKNYKDVKGQYSTSFIKRMLCVKIKEDDESVFVCIAATEKEDEVRNILLNFHNHKKIIWTTVNKTLFAEFIGRFIDREENGADTKQKSIEQSISDVSLSKKVVNIVNSICLTALRLKASDIHLHLTKSSAEVRYRVDGVLSLTETIERSLYQRIIQRFRLLAGLNITEKKKPQDGRITANIGSDFFDARVSLLPSESGDVLVIRLFDTDENKLELKSLMFSKRVNDTLVKASNMKTGLFLVTGPTGCGKSTTLHSLLHMMDRKHLKIVTIEDPVERYVDGVDQICVNEKEGLTFSAVLRSVLRQDPDVIMVGEIRDKESVTLAVRAALTGHLVLSTLHTNDSVSAITRMLDLGVERYLLSSVLKMCMSQRLVRKKKIDFNGKEIYSGRVAVSEIFEVNDDIASLINENKGEIAIRDYLKKHNFVSLKSDALSKVPQITGIDELERVGLL